MFVCQYAKQGSLRKLLDNRYKDLIKGLVAIHEANLVHKDFHSGNIVNDNTYNSFITDFGLCRPKFLLDILHIMTYHMILA
ncbi:hypothetical protein C2G38_2128435 [Gigaspora rosea]|uniref:Protein kinase domain-containing protein n=1 Tax=Gigaspora rosea TaxID=44941 RepID=A0A397U1Z0_9GLOM|nr:hypothetical protein C2G38_2128435 [Gigaspora rosea]